MRTKSIIKNIIISITIGILLGIITEFALILNINWLIKITQSFEFWGIIICIGAFISKDYKLSIINPSVILTLMNITYYIIRLAMSGYTDMDGCTLYTITGVAGSMYIGTIISIIKDFYHKQKNSFCKYNFLLMTIGAILFVIFGFYNILIMNNLFYNIDIGIIVSFSVSVLVKIKKENSN